MKHSFQALCAAVFLVRLGQLVPLKDGRLGHPVLKNLELDEGARH